jgi:aryl-alcohol dehydrogenase-like predicted oxidoreductase
MSDTLRSNLRIDGIDTPLSRLALGTAFYQPDAKDLWFELLDEFVREGGTVLDSARIYSGGASERVLGEWIASRQNRGNVVLITKCGHGDDGRLPAENLRQVVQTELQTSLDILQTDYVDLYMLHRDNTEVEVGEILDALHEQVDAGRVKALGASNWTYDRIDEARRYADQAGIPGFTAVSNNLSLAEPACPFFPGLVSVDSEGVAWHYRTQVPLLSWSSQARGFFTGRIRPELRDAAELITDPWMERMMEVYGTDENFERLSRAEELARDRNCSPVQIALAWVLRQEAPVIPIIGPHNLQELASCIEACGIALNAEEAKWLMGGNNS